MLWLWGLVEGRVTLGGKHIIIIIVKAAVVCCVGGEYPVGVSRVSISSSVYLKDIPLGPVPGTRHARYSAVSALRAAGCGAFLWS